MQYFYLDKEVFKNLYALSGNKIKIALVVCSNAKYLDAPRLRNLDKIAEKTGLSKSTISHLDTETSNVIQGIMNKQFLLERSTPYRLLSVDFIKFLRQLSGQSVKVYLYLLDMMNIKTNETFVGREKIAEDLHMRNGDVTKAVKELEEAKLINITRRYNSTNIYKLNVENADVLKVKKTSLFKRQKSLSLSGKNRSH